MNTQQMYALSLDQIATAIATVGHQRTVLVQGHMGTGKTSILKMLAAMFPDHVPCHFDCTTKDLGDISIPSLNTDEGFVKYLPNEELGIHHGKPIILMVDEFGKANPAVKNALLRVMLERKNSGYELHPDSIVFATTNLGAEGVGDLLPPHARNRITVITVRKSTSEEFIVWGLNNDVDHSVLGFVREFPHVLQGFEDVKNPDDNPYIFHPKAQRAAFITPRSLEASSDWLKIRHLYDDHTLTALLVGTIGDRGGLDIMTYVKMSDQLPSLQSIKDDPYNAKVPESASAVCMTVFRALGAMERNWVDAWVTYMQRLNKEAQGLFANGARVPTYKHRNIVMQSAKFTTWARENNYMFAADQ